MIGKVALLNSLGGAPHAGVQSRTPSPTSPFSDGCRSSKCAAALPTDDHDHNNCEHDHRPRNRVDRVQYCTAAVTHSVACFQQQQHGSRRKSIVGQAMVQWCVGFGRGKTNGVARYCTGLSGALTTTYCTVMHKCVTM